MRNFNNSYKLFAGFLALVLVAGMSTPAFAAESEIIIALDPDIIAQAATNNALLENVIFDNDGATPIPFAGNEMTAWLQTEDFAFDERTTVRDVHFILFEVEEDAWDGSLEYWIFADNAGEPGPILASGAAANLGTNVLDTEPVPRTEVWFDLQEGFDASAGVTYHLGLHANIGNGYTFDGVAWEIATPGFGDTGIESFEGLLNNWFNNGREHYFLLTGGDQLIGGTVGSMSTTSLLVAGAQSNMGLWSLALVGIVGAAAAITYKLKSKKTEQ